MANTPDLKIFIVMISPVEGKINLFNIQADDNKDYKVYVSQKKEVPIVGDYIACYTDEQREGQFTYWKTIDKEEQKKYEEKSQSGADWDARLEHDKKVKEPAITRMACNNFHARLLDIAATLVLNEGEKDYDNLFKTAINLRTWCIDNTEDLVAIINKASTYNDEES